MITLERIRQAQFKLRIAGTVKAQCRIKPRPKPDMDRVWTEKLRMVMASR